MRPVIGISCSTEKIGDWQLPMDYVRHAYSAACENAGLLPVLLPVTADESVREAQLDLVDGLLLSGGDDVYPGLYGEGDTVHPATEPPDERRDRHEIALIHSAVRRDLPILAICRGLQILNVAFGGTLIQDLPAISEEKRPHRQQALTFETSHCLTVVEDSLLSKAFGGLETVPVNSHHHQAVKAAAPGLAVSARADDGVIEAMERPDSSFVLGVQWHPENLHEDPSARALFAAFAAAVGKRKHAE